MQGPRWLPLLASLSAFADSPPVVDEFRWMGGSLACIMAAPRPAGNAGYDSCLRIGKVRVGGPYSEIVKKFGEPNDSQPVDEGRAQARIYIFDKNPETLTYIAVWETKGTIIAVQMTGTMTDMPSFAGVQLGDDSEKLKAKLGPPSKIRPSGSYDLWSYQPFPFSIEVREGRVYSIKVWRAGVRGPCGCGKPGCCKTAASANP